MDMNSWTRRRLLALAMGCMAAATGHAQAAPPIDTLARIKAEGVIRIGVRNSAPPFAHYDANNRPAGFTWDLCRALVKHMEVELKRSIEIKPTPVSLPESFEMLKDGRIDLQCGSTTHTAERAQQVDFSNSFFVSGIAVAYRKEDVQFARPLQFGRVAVVTGSTAANIMAKRFAGKGASAIDAVVPVKSYDEGIEKLKKKEADTLFADSVLIPLDPEIDRRRSLETVEPYALMMRKGDRAFGELVDQSLMKVLGSSTVRQFATEAKLDGKLNALTLEAWRRPSREPAPQLY